MTAPAWIPVYGHFDGPIWCSIHDMEVCDCDCDPIEDWTVDPYVTGGVEGFESATWGDLAEVDELSELGPNIAALYVDVKRGPYLALGLDCWGMERDASTWDGPGRCIAHPDCGPWSRLSHFCGDALNERKRLAPIAVAQVRKWGGRARTSRRLRAMGALRHVAAR